MVVTNARACRQQDEPISTTNATHAIPDHAKLTYDERQLQRPLITKLCELDVVINKHGSDPLM